ncbi:anti-sigma factor family protein [Edaphobacter albus]|uniref:anti-sigma factor family protein n=1 Tax=Edaphobacter sp. 4G125 TaxID=2763071 RepID=UPI001647711D|nr:zf-HC2 domain-containing protein [Edaphobacter sp. 4G125]QNI36112.1 zf-HC2 domain-containing protein [Edaphobacter sp. 4G125]
MVLNCRHVWDYISGYLDNTLDAQTRTDVEKHLEHCEICSAVLDSTRNILILTADDRVFELPVGFSERLHARLAQAMLEIPPDEPESSA